VVGEWTELDLQVSVGGRGARGVTCF
jgi:hypothetical protein